MSDYLRRKQLYIGKYVSISEHNFSEHFSEGNLSEKGEKYFDLRVNRSPTSKKRKEIKVKGVLKRFHVYFQEICVTCERKGKGRYILQKRKKLQKLRI